MTYRMGSFVDPNGKYGPGQRKTRVIAHHWGDPALNYSYAGVANEMSRPGRQASVNFIVDWDGTMPVIHPSVPVNMRAWTSGSNAADAPAITYELKPFFPGQIPAAFIQGIGEHMADLVSEGHLDPAFTLHGHREFQSTDCPGEYMDVLDDIAAVAHGGSTGGRRAPAPVEKPKGVNDELTVDGSWGDHTTRVLQHMLGTTEDGVISGQLEDDAAHWPNVHTIEIGDGGSQMVKALQKVIGANADGYAGEQTCRALQAWVATPVDGYFGPASVKNLQITLNRLRAQGKGLR